MNSFRILLYPLLLAVFVTGHGCGSPEKPIQAGNTALTSAAPEQTDQAAEAPPEELDPSILDRLKNESWKGDVGGLLERRYVRVLVLYNKTNFFYDGPQPRGITYEALTEFGNFLNKKLNTGDKPLHMVFIPVTREEGLKRIADGRGDIAASNIPIVPELQKIVDFSDPVRGEVKEIVVTGASAPQVATLDDLSGKEVFVRKISRYWPNLEKLNEQFRQTGKAPIILREADSNLEDEDILEMVNAGVINITVMDDLVAGFWGKVFPGIAVRNDLQIAGGDQIGWAVQKGTPDLLALMNEFVKDNKVGTSFGNTLIRKYTGDTKWAKNNTNAEEMEKFKTAVAFFKKYGAEYDFDWLMIAAQAFQESGIDQSRRSQAGAVGVMQIKPSTAEDKTIGISNVDTDMEKNINAGVKYLDYISKRYFADPSMKRNDRSLFAFASYNAGPARVAQLRKQAEADGLNPNVWFNNVELIAAKKIGPETVTYVSNIYKYYVAYKMVNENIARKK
jgi:membrane-bound lytic murein transglycosylase MltF